MDTTNGHVNGHPENDGHHDQVEVAYQNNLRAHRQGISNPEVIKAYDAWADYDKDLCPGVYNGPAIAAQTLCDVFPDVAARAAIKILDVAAGTGRVGLELHARGFRNLDALEPSHAMREQCTSRQIYRDIHSDVIGERPTDLSAGSYDAVVVAGGMGEGHIPVRGVDEMARLLKPGGTLCVVMREEYLTTVPEYQGKLEPRLDHLVSTDTLEKVSRQVVPNYSFNKNGVVFLYRAR